MHRLVAALAATLLLTACGHGSGLEEPGVPSLGILATTVGQPVSIGIQGMCVKGAAPVTVQSVRFGTAEHLAVRRFAVRTVRWDRNEALGADRVSLDALGIDPARRTVARQCGARDDRTTTELDLEMAADAPVGRAHSLEVVYRLGYRSLSVRSTMEIMVCSYPSERCPTS